MRCRLVRLEGKDEDGAWTDYDPEKALAGMRAAAGSWSDIDAEAFKEYIYRAREEGSRPFERVQGLSFEALEVN